MRSRTSSPPPNCVNRWRMKRRAAVLRATGRHQAGAACSRRSSRRASGAVVPLLSLIVITRNEEASIERCLRSAAFADEIVVVDNHSADKTVEIARRLGARVISAPDWPGVRPAEEPGVGRGDRGVGVVARRRRMDRAAARGRDQGRDARSCGRGWVRDAAAVALLRQDRRPLRMVAGLRIAPVAARPRPLRRCAGA